MKSFNFLLIPFAYNIYDLSQLEDIKNELVRFGHKAFKLEKKLTEEDLCKLINNGDFNYLPVINGIDSEKHAAKFLNILSSEPNLFHQVWAITYIGKRRWNVSLRSGVKIKLPEKSPSEAWAKLSEIDRNESLLSREIDIIDLRKDGYIIIKPSKKLSIERST